MSGSSYTVGVARRTLSIDPTWVSADEIWAWGFGSRDTAVTQKAIDAREALDDRLLVTALVIGDQEGNLVALAALDLGNIAAETTAEIRRQVALAVPISGDCICLNVSHTHAAPTMVELTPFWNGGTGTRHAAFHQQVIDLTVEAIVEAYNNRQAADLYFGRASTQIAMNRLDKGASPDPALDVLHATGASGPIATVFRVSCHPVWMAAPTISADFPFAARKVVEATHGTALFVQGWAGICDPANHETIKKMTDDTSAMDAHGEQLGREVVAVLARPDLTRLQGPVGGRSITLSHPLKRGGQRVAQEVQALFFGDGDHDWCLVGCAHEVTTDQVPSVQDRLLHTRVTLAGYCNDQQCYLPSDNLINDRDSYEGNASQAIYGHVHEGAANPFELGAAERLLQGILEVTDAGWTTIGTATQVTAMAAEGDWLYCTTSNNFLWRRPTDASDDTWEAIGMAHLVSGLAVLDGVLYCATQLGGLWKRPVEGGAQPWVAHGEAQGVLAMTAADGLLYCATDLHVVRTRPASGGDGSWALLGAGAGIKGLAVAQERLVCAAGGVLQWRTRTIGEEDWRPLAPAEVIALCRTKAHFYAVTSDDRLLRRPV